MGSLRATALALIATTTVAQAQPKPTPAQIQQASALVKKAIAKSQAGDHTLAIDLYQQAFNIIPQPILLSNIGSEYQQAQKPADAVKYFCKYLEADPTGSNAAFATGQVKTLQGQLGNDVDDSDVCHPKVKPTPPPVVVEAPPLTGTTFGPTGGPTREPTSHPGRGLEITGVVVAVAGAVSLGVGIHYALNGRSLSQQINAHKLGDPWPSQIDGVPIADWGSTGDRWNRNAYIFSIAGGVAVIAGGALFLVGHGKGSDTSTEHARLVPVAGPHDAGLALVGSF
jgi:tetratricopeptide (TPR) repeat protein